MVKEKCCAKVMQLVLLAALPLIAVVMLLVGTRAGQALIGPSEDLALIHSCEIEEHIHDDGCYERVLISVLDKTGEGNAEQEIPTRDQQEDRSEATSDIEAPSGDVGDAGDMGDAAEQNPDYESQPADSADNITDDRISEEQGHVHTDDACYEYILTCRLEVHTHGIDCSSSNRESAGFGKSEIPLTRMTVTNNRGELIYEYPNPFGHNPAFFYRDNYSFSLTFSSEGMAGSVFTYELPAGLDVTSDATGNLYAVGSNEPVGFYSVITGETSYVEMQLIDSGIAVAPAFEFDLYFSADFTIDYSGDGHAYGDKVSEASGSGGILGTMTARDTWDLSSFVTGVSILDQNGNPITNGEFFIGENYNFSVTFAERLGTGGQFSYNTDGFLVYQLPQNIAVILEQTGLIRLDDSTPVGTYTIYTSGLVEARFIDSDGINYIDEFENVVFRLDIAAQFTSTTGPGKIIFGTGAEISIITVTYPPAGLRVTKISSTYDLTAESLRYNIAISAVGGRITDIVLDDIATFNQPGDFRIDGRFSSAIFTGVRYRVVSQSGSVLENWRNSSLVWNVETNAWRIEFPGVTLNTGDRVEVEYF
jgi:hypothetical protein